MLKFSEKLLESRRRELVLTKAEFAAWLGFRSSAKRRTQALCSQYFQLCRALAGDKRYSAGPRTLRRVAEKMGFNHNPALPGEMEMTK